MSDTPLPPNITQLQAVVANARFTPTQSQIRSRSEFWSKQVGEVSPDADLAVVTALGASGRGLDKWWAIPGFREWYLSKDWNKHAAELLLIQAMSALSAVMRDAVDHTTLINAAKEARTLHAQMNAVDTKEEKFADAAIGEMSREELTAFINKRQRQ